MDVCLLYEEVTSQSPNYDLIRNVLKKNPDLINGIIEDSGSALHHAARTDTIYGTSLTDLLLNEFEANPNFSNSSGSLPVFWALAASEEVKHKGKVPYWNSITSLIESPKFKPNKLLIYRGIAKKFMISEYGSTELTQILNLAKWKRNKGIIQAKEYVETLPLN